MRGRHMIKCWSKAQQVVSLSSGEAELYAGVRAASEMLGVAALTKDLGMSGPLSLAVDAAAAIAMISREGLGRAKHIDTQFLWVQEKVRAGIFKLHKVGTNLNPSDLFTKQLDERAMVQHLARMGCEAPWAEMRGRLCKGGRRS